MSSTETSDSGMVKMMGIVGGALCVITLTCMVIARFLGIGDADATDALLRNALIERIQPVGSVRTAAMAANEAPAELVAAAPATPEELANGTCAACHIAGIGGAPKFDDKAEWDKRSEAGLAALVASVVNGKGGMPPRGGSTYSDEDIERAVKYMTGL